MQLVSNGITTANINCETGPYFATSCGVRQGDLLSPFLFNLLVAFAAILDAAKHVGHIRRICLYIIREFEITHLQYADDIILTVEGSYADIRNIKFLLL